MNFDELIAVEAADDTISWVGQKLGIVVLQAKSSDKVVATWIFEREIKGTNPPEYERQQITAISPNRRHSIAKVINGISELADIDVSVKLLPYREQVRLLRDQLGDDLLEE